MNITVMAIIGAFAAVVTASPASAVEFDRVHAQEWCERMLTRPKAEAPAVCAVEDYGIQMWTKEVVVGKPGFDQVKEAFEQICAETREAVRDGAMRPPAPSIRLKDFFGKQIMVCVYP